ncbi:MAG TPA: hypothetical protein VK619_03745 [Pyrinomonadaceae bacterium]|nr:hypothetical protein [Pyrinomonadaceae bacterium]
MLEQESDNESVNPLAEDPFDVVNELNPSPDARVFFRGLLLLEPLTDNTGKRICLVSVHRSADPHHNLKIDIRLVQAGMSWQYPAPTVPFDLHNFTIEVSPNGQGVKKYHVDNNPLDRTAASSNRDFDNDYRWRIDFAELHNGSSMVDKQITFPGILLKDGVLHTAVKTDESKVSIELISPNNPVTDLHSIADIIGANISFDSPSTLNLSWRYGGEEQNLSLEKPPSGSHYEIYVYNDPGTTDSHNEFQEYYKVLLDAGTGAHFLASQEFNLDVTLKSQPTPGSSGDKGDRVPCMPGGHGG